MQFKLRTIKDKEALLSYIDKLKIGKVVYVADIKKHTAQRSTDQNRLYWLWLACLSEETGYNRNELHKLLAEMFLPCRETIIFGRFQKEAVSTTSLTTDQFKDYLDKIQIFASSEIGVELPNPEELHWESFEQHYSNMIR